MFHQIDPLHQINTTWIIPIYSASTLSSGGPIHLLSFSCGTPSLVQSDPVKPDVLA